MIYFSLKILLGYRCNQCCPYCDTPKDDEYDFDQFDKAKELIEFLKDQQGFYIELDGGDAMMYPEAIKWAIQFGLPVYIFTNGTLINDEICQQMNKNAIFRVSLDGVEEIHNKQKVMKSGENGFQQTMRGIQTLEKYNIPYIIGMTITENTIPLLEKSRALLKSLKAQRIIMTTEMFPNDPNREKTYQIWEKAYPIIKGWYDPYFQYYSFHEQPSEVTNVEIMLKKDRIELNIAGYDTPTLSRFNYSEIDKVKEAILAL